MTGHMIVGDDQNWIKKFKFWLIENQNEFLKFQRGFIASQRVTFKKIIKKFQFDGWGDSIEIIFQ